MIAEWTPVANGQDLHKTTIYTRMNELGWDQTRAKSKPVRRFTHRDGSLNIADAARAIGLNPTIVQRVMRVWKATFAEAVVYILGGGR